jgi:phosphate transport system substrate-binding protein
MKNDKSAVSPVIATLMLILIAVGSAVALYAWQSGWQKSVTGGIGNQNVRDSITIGGSTTVYEFNVYAAQYYEQANPGTSINVQKGGSGAGVAAVGTGAIDIGASSAPIADVAGSSNYPDLNKDGVKDVGRDLVQTKVAYDAVVMIVNTGAAHLLTSISTLDIQAIYYANGGAAVVPAAIAAEITALDTVTVDGKIQWNEVPQAAGTLVPKCAGAGTVVVYDRSDISGTEETFAKNMIVCGKNTVEEVGITASHVASNQEMATKIAGDANGLGFCAYGVAKTASGVSMPSLLLSKSDVNNNGVAGEAGDIADPSSGSFTTWSKTPSKVAGYMQYAGGKALYWVTVGEPQGAVSDLVHFVLSPENNANICAAGGYINLY